MNNKKPSENLSAFLNFITTAQSHYNFCLDEMKKQEQLTQDYLHSLELDGLSCKERSKLATKLVINRKDRRYYKDRVEELEPIINWLSDPTNTKAINFLKQTLGEVRKQENYHKNRTYTPKVLNEEDKMIIFTLSMPHRGSGNNGWSGDGKVYARKRHNKAVPSEVVGKDFYYTWPDGWTACVSVEKVDAKEADKIMKKSVGFYGYDWMIDSIIKNKEIKI